MNTITPATLAFAIDTARKIIRLGDGRFPNGKRRGAYGIARRVAELVAGGRHPEIGVLRTAIEQAIAGEEQRPGKSRGVNGPDCGACDAVTECLCR